MIFLWLLSWWADSAALSIVCWLLYVLLWVWLHRHTYPSVRDGHAAFNHDTINRALSWWLRSEVFPVLLLVCMYRRYQAFLAHQRSIEQLKKMGWQVEVRKQPDGSLGIYCDRYLSGATAEEMRAEVVQAHTIVEEGLNLR